ncbi:MAG: hypothetical protein O7F16_04935, partial [Acidobacteria bacterium]|nr:hypothetical protein [Acidobacteriota bacterium]
MSSGKAGHPGKEAGHRIKQNPPDRCRPEAFSDELDRIIIKRSRCREPPKQPRREADPNTLG